MMRADSEVPFSVSGETRVRTPLKVIGVIVGVAAAGTAAWAVAGSNIASNTRRIEALEIEARANREVLIRIDERTAEIKRQIERGK